MNCNWRCYVACRFSFQIYSLFHIFNHESGENRKTIHTYIQTYVYYNKINPLRHNVFTSKQNFTVRWPINVYRYFGKKITTRRHIEKRSRKCSEDTDIFQCESININTFCTIAAECGISLCVRISLDVWLAQSYYHITETYTVRHWADSWYTISQQILPLLLL